MASLPVCASPGPRVLTAVLLLFVVGCRSDTAELDYPVAVSSVYSDFRPDVELRQRGFLVDAAACGGRVCPRETSGWKTWQGSLVLPADTKGCEVVAVAIREALNGALGHPCRDELNLDLEPDSPRRRYGMLRYLHQGMRGHVQIWLFADESETQIDFAIFLREDQCPSNSFIGEVSSNAVDPGQAL